MEEEVEREFCELTKEEREKKKLKVLLQSHEDYLRLVNRFTYGMMGGLGSIIGLTEMCAGVFLFLAFLFKGDLEGMLYGLLVPAGFLIACAGQAGLHYTTEDKGRKTRLCQHCYSEVYVDGYPTRLKCNVCGKQVFPAWEIGARATFNFLNGIILVLQFLMLIAGFLAG